MKALVVAVAVILALTGCSAHATKAEPSPSVYDLAPNVHCADFTCRGYKVDPYIRTRSRYGIGCMGNVPPGTKIPDELPPQSYAVKYLGKDGFPRLTDRERATVARYKKLNSSPYLRIAWVSSSAGPHHMIVFDAYDGPCEVWAGGYSVLNGTCNEFYQPGENPYGTHAGSGCYPSDPRPQTVPTDTP